MKKIKGFILALIVVFLMPLAVFAEDKINVYIFRGEGCQYCAKALAFFEGLDDEYQSYFNLVEREVWYDTDNATLMQTVADYFGDTVKGVPYIIIGDKTFNGYTTEYDDDIKAAIKTAYENEDGSYQDIVGPILEGTEVTKTTSDNTNITIIIIIVIIAGIGFLVYMARDDEKPATKVKNEPKKQESVKKEANTKKTTSVKKSTTTKKSTSTKKTAPKKASSTKKTTSKK